MKIKTIRSPRGRLLTLEYVETDATAAAVAEEIARVGGSDGYIVVSDHPGAVPPLSPSHRDAPTLCVSVLLRPSLPPSRVMLLSVAAAVALTRAVRQFSANKIGIKWVTDVYDGKHRIGTVTTKGALRPDGGFRYILVNFTLSLTKDTFKKSLSEIVKDVFSPQREPLTDRIAETLITEFAGLYEEIGTDHSFLEEYRDASLLRGKKIRILQEGKRRRATVLGIDDDANLVVVPRTGNSILLHSVSELYDPKRY